MQVYSNSLLILYELNREPSLLNISCSTSRCFLLYITNFCWFDLLTLLNCKNILSIYKAFLLSPYITRWIQIVYSNPLDFLFLLSLSELLLIYFTAGLTCVAVFYLYRTSGLFYGSGCLLTDLFPFEPKGMPDSVLVPSPKLQLCLEDSQQ